MASWGTSFVTSGRPFWRLGNETPRSQRRRINPIFGCGHPKLGLFEARWRIFGVSQLDPRGALGARKARVRAPVEYLNLGLHFLALHFCISPLGLHFSQHFTSCTYFAFLHCTPCTYFPARHFTPCTHFSALTFSAWQFTSRTHFSALPASTYVPAFTFLYSLLNGVPQGVEFPFENAPLCRDFLLDGGGSCRDCPHEGGSFLEWGPARS